MSDRREFLGQALMLAGAASLVATAASAQTHPVEKAAKPLRILILGGTGFIGPHHVRYAVARGHHVSVFNRGKRQADLPPEVEHLTGDRTGDLTSITGRDWDAVIDLPTTFPNWVRTVGQAIAKRTKHYSFISSLAVYAPSANTYLNEDSPLWEYKGAEDPYTLTKFGLDLYGPLKTLSEREAEKQFPGRTMIVRPALIVGPGDESDRFTYWPLRMKQGGEILVGGDPLDPAEYIDVRDLAEFVVRGAERGVTGAYNGVGPAMPMSMAELFGGMRAVSAVPMKLTWVPTAWLQQNNVTTRDLPVWSPPPLDIGMHADPTRSVAHGMTYRTLATTVSETLAWYETLSPERQAAPRSGWKLAREQEVLAAWHARKA